MSYHWCQGYDSRCIQYQNDSPIIFEFDNDQNGCCKIEVNFCPICGHNRKCENKKVWRGELGRHSEPFISGPKMKMYPANYTDG